MFITRVIFVESLYQSTATCLTNFAQSVFVFHSVNSTYLFLFNGSDARNILYRLHLAYSKSPWHLVQVSLALASGFLNHLFWWLIYINYCKILVIRPFIHIQQVFHAGNKITALMWWNYLSVYFSGLELVFLTPFLSFHKKYHQHILTLSFYLPVIEAPILKSYPGSCRSLMLLIVPKKFYYELCKSRI